MSNQEKIPPSGINLQKMIFGLDSCCFWCYNAGKRGLFMEKNLTVWFTSPQKKIRPRSHLTWGKCESYHIYLAKNATEGCQVSFMAPEERKNFSIEVQGDLAGAGLKAELLREHYVSCAGAEYPDPVVPDDGRFSLEPKRNVTYLINIISSENTTAGTYNFKVVLKENGKLYGKYSLKVTVWNFALDHNAFPTSMFSITKDYLFLRHPTYDKQALYKKYYDFMLDKYHITGYEPPYEITDPRVAEYLDDPRVKSFCLTTKLSDEAFAEIYNVLKDKPVWMDKCCIEMLDEPCFMKDYDAIHAAHDRVSKVFPNPPAYSAFFENPRDGKGTTAEELLRGYNRILVPKARLFGNKKFAESMYKRRDGGDKLFWYVCWEPGLPYANLLVDMEGFYHRVLFWQQYFYRVDGLLYWTTTWWRDCDPWDSASTVCDLDFYCFGDGSMFYPGNRVGIDGPVGSLRFELIRSGIEDFYMFSLAEKAFGRKYVDKLIKSVTPNIREYNDDHDALDRVRVTLGNRLSKYYSENEK